MAQSITKNALYNVLLNITSVIFPLVTVPYISRVLEPDGVGLYNFVVTYAGYFAFVAMLGIPIYGVREVSKSRDDKEALTKLISQLMSISAITTLAVSIIYVVTIVLIGQLSENYIIFLLAGFAIYLAPFKVNWYFRGVEDFGLITKVSLAVRTLSIVCLFVFVRDKSDLVIYVILGILGGVMADLWTFFKMWESGVKPKFTLEGLKPHISHLLVLFASSIAISVYTVLDTLMLGFVRDYEEVGYYTNAMHVSKVILTAVTSLSIVAVPRVSYYMKNGDYDNISILMNKSFSVVSFLAIPVAIGLACISPTFVLIVTLSFVYLRTKIKIDRWIDVVKSFLGALLFIPLLFSLKSFLNGWWLVVVFVVTGGVVYSLSELILKNGSFALFKNVAENSISSIKSRCYAIL